MAAFPPRKTPPPKPGAKPAPTAKNSPPRKPPARAPAPAGPSRRGAPFAPPPQAAAPPAALLAPPVAPPAPGGLPSMSALSPGADGLPPSQAFPAPPGAAPMAPAAPPTAAPDDNSAKPNVATALQSIMKGAAKAQAKPPTESRPEVPQATKSAVTEWWADTDNLTQRANALWQFREANKTLFPARFNASDPRRGQTPMELKTGRDTRRVQLPRIFRDSLQTTAMTVPDDLEFRWTPAQQVEPPQNPMVPQTQSLDPVTPSFGKTLTIIESALLGEARLHAKLRAWVQDSSCYPAAILKYVFRREFNTTYLNATPPDRDVTDAAALLESLVQGYANKDFTEPDARFKQMLDLTSSLQQNARLTRWFGVELTLIPLDAFGISEDASDLVSIYDAAFMFNDVLMTGEAILARFPYVEPDAQGDTYGVCAEELTAATPWDADNASTDPNSKNRASRNRQNTSPKPLSGQGVGINGKSTDPKKKKYLVREIWSKKTRTVYTLIKGLDHYIEKRVPQHLSERWYPFAVLAPNRVPTEIYGASDLELKADVQARINRKRTDEEKARWLSLDRLIYNTQAMDEKEVVKLGDIPPGQAKGINLGSPSAKISDAIMTFAYSFKPEAFDTSKDERDGDMLGALPVQALGSTGVANYAAEVDSATQGAAIAVKQRQAIVRDEIEGMLHALAEILLQEITPDEARLIAGPYAFWPKVYDEVEAQKIVEQAKQAAIQQVAPEVMAMTAQSMMTGAPLDPTAIQAQLDQKSAPLWQAMLVEQYGTAEPQTRETLYRRLKVRVTSTLLSSMDRQQRIQSVTMMAQTVLTMTQAAQLAGIPFNPRVLIKKAAQLLDDTEDFDEMFPAVSPLMLAEQQVQAGAGVGPGGAPGQPGTPAPGGGPPEAQGDQAQQAPPSVKSQGATQGGGRPSPAQAAVGG